MKMEQTVCSEMLAYKIQTPGNYPEESTQYLEQGESLKSRIIRTLLKIMFFFPQSFRVNNGDILSSI